jgi:hypothetical protein
MGAILSTLRTSIIHPLLGAAAAFGVFGAAQAQGAGAAGADLSGVYFTEYPAEALETVDGRPIPLTRAGRAALAANGPGVAASKVPPVGMALEACLPFGPTRVLQQPYPLEIVQEDGTMLLIWEHNHIFELVYMNEPPRPDADASYMGSSVGRWDGDTLVIDTANYNDATFLDENGLPHSENLKVQRRLRKTDDGKALEIQATVTDPAMYSRPWTVRTTLPLRPDVSIEEYVCGQNTLETRYTRRDK